MIFVLNSFLEFNCLLTFVYDPPRWLAPGPIPLTALIVADGANTLLFVVALHCQFVSRIYTPLSLIRIKICPVSRPEPC